MTKPSQELLRRAREHSEETGSGIPPIEAATKWRNHPWTGEDIVRTADEIVMSKAEFAEQIVRECAKVAYDEFGGMDASEAILRKFVLEKE